MTASLPSVSVIVPHYDDLDRLDRCLAALEAQTMPRSDYEILIADNGTPAGLDAVRDVVRDRARLIEAPMPGAGPARNAGAAAARGQILAFTDCDCVPDAAWLEEGVRALDTADFVGGRMVVTVRSPERMSAAEAFETVFAFQNRSYVLEKHFTVTANLFCPATMFRDVGPFRTKVSEDKEWCLRARDKGYRIGYADKAIIAHPARSDWPELRRKWRRMSAESYALMREGGGSRLSWLVRTWALPLSILPHAARVLTDDRLPAARDRIGALAMLVLSRLWRFIEGHCLLLRREG